MLQGFPMVSQLTTVTGDGQPSENAQFDCVAASIDAACRYLLGTPENSVFNPDHFKDEGAGQGYKGGTEARAYVPFCQALGVKLWSFQGGPVALVNEAHTQLAAGHPVVFTEPDPYVSASLGWSHVCVFYADMPGYLVALDPYIAKPIRRTDQEWETMLLFNEIWVLEKEVIVLDITMPDVAALFKELSPTSWQSLATGSVIHDGLLADFKANGQASLDYLGDVVQNEVSIGPGKSLQRHAKGVRVWDNGHVSSLPLYVEGPGQDPWVDKLKTALTAEQATNAQLQAQLAALQSQPAAPVLSPAQLAALEALAAAFGHTLV